MIRYDLLFAIILFVSTLTAASTPDATVVDAVPGVVVVAPKASVWKYGPGSSGAVPINSLARLAAALIVR